MKLGYTILFLLYLPLLGICQPMFSPNFNNFLGETMQNALANSPVEFMTAEEQKVVFYMNLARLEPQVFLNDILIPYVAFYKLNVNGYVKSLYKDLQESSANSSFDMQKDLYEVSYTHLTDIGEKGLTGHRGSKGRTFQKRVNELLKTYSAVSENVGLGFKYPLDNVIGLLIDDGVKDLGHRKAILSSDYNGVGVSLGNHKDYTYGCVMDFGKRAEK